VSDVDARLAAAGREWPHASRLLRVLAADGQLRAAIEFLLPDPGYLPFAESVVAAAAALYRDQGRGEDDLVEAVLEYTYLYARHQVSFVKTGAYSQSDFARVYEEVYDNEELMLGTYLPGLLLTQAVWPVHYHVQRRFAEAFLDGFDPAPARLVEFGVGHGWTLFECLRRFPGATTLAVDVSRHSIQFSGRVLRANGVDPARVTFVQADVTKYEPEVVAAADAGVMGEILEHVEDPGSALRAFRRLLRVGARAFVTTVIDSNAIDHIYQFKSQEEIDSMITGHGFELERSELVEPRRLRLGGELGSDPTRYYLAVARAK
jgi:SAM-dependent methyltransferase